ncbi:gliding motility-associated C-terminal domain-containing protein [Chryseolinea sp. T2]|uniref:T9SS type B sorting domain-containing protein n=1 Tax=Chryseolinea sp. T2 TaxID=3129255 RepID=UPI003077B939
MTPLHRYHLWLLLTVGIAAKSHAQVHNSSNLYVGSDVEIHVEGSVSNSGFVQNQGELRVTGDWLNTNVYQGLGRLTLNGNTTQRLSNNGNSIYSLRVNTTGIVDWQDKLVIDNRLDLTSGNIRIADPNSITLAATATVAGGSPSSFVEGPMVVRGTGYKFMPIGTNSGYYPVEFLDVSGIDPVVKVEAFDQMPAFRLEGYGRVTSNVYWQQTVLSGTFSGSPVALGYDLPSDAADGALAVYQSPAQSDVFTDAGNSSISNSNGIEKITTSGAVTGSLLLIGERVVVAPGSEAFYFPSSISPDAADPNNRTVKVFGEQLTEDGFQFVVFNRWGQQVFESRSLEYMTTTGWSGQQQAGGILASGGYPYMLMGKFKNGETLRQKGMISVVR